MECEAKGWVMVAHFVVTCRLHAWRLMTCLSRCLQCQDRGHQLGGAWPGAAARTRAGYGGGRRRADGRGGEQGPSRDQPLLGLYALCELRPRLLEQEPKLLPYGWLSRLLRGAVQVASPMMAAWALRPPSDRYGEGGGGDGQQEAEGQRPVSSERRQASGTAGRRAEAVSGFVDPCLRYVSEFAVLAHS